MDNPAQHLRDAALHTLEGMCFELVELITDGGGRQAQVGSAQVAFEGELCGSVVVHVHDVALRRLVANMLGLDALMDDGPLVDGLCEIANVICGHVVSSYSRCSAAVSLSAPRVLDEAERGRLLVRPCAAAVTLRLEQGELTARLYLTEPGSRSAP